MAFSQNDDRKLWAIHPVGARHGTAKATRCMDGYACFHAFPGAITVCNESQPRCISQPVADRGEAKEAVGLLAPGGVSPVSRFRSIRPARWHELRSMYDNRKDAVSRVGVLLLRLSANEN